MAREELEELLTTRTVTMTNETVVSSCDSLLFGKRLNFFSASRTSKSCVTSCGTRDRPDNERLRYQWWRTNRFFLHGPSCFCSTAVVNGILYYCWGAGRGRCAHLLCRLSFRSCLVCLPHHGHRDRDINLLTVI